MAPSYTKSQKWLLSPSGLRFTRRLADSFFATLHHAERIPREGPALIASNHSFAGLDSVPLGALIIQHTGRAPYFLAERNLWRCPGVRSVFEELGCAPGTHEDAIRLLSRGELVVVYPGGVDDAFKLSREAYTLKWGDRRGFARVALEAKVPLVPIAATGIDETYEFHHREHIFGRRVGGSPRYDMPLPKRILPRRVPFHYYVLPPIGTSGRSSDPRHVERLRRACHEAIDSVLRPYRERMKRLGAVSVESI